MQRRHHYESALEYYLRERRVPYVAVDEARKAILPPGAEFTYTASDNPAHVRTLKSFDLVLYGKEGNLLVEVKGRRVGGSRAPKVRLGPDGLPMPNPPAKSRLESWVTQEDIDALTRWEALFGPGFEAALVFVYWCDEQPPDALFDEIWEHRGRWYAARGIGLSVYKSAMKVRSPRWRTVHLPAAAFDRLARPLFSRNGERQRGGPLTGNEFGSEFEVKTAAWRGLREDDPGPESMVDRL